MKFGLIILDKFCDTEGNILAILIDYQDNKILIEGLYGPNSDSPSSYSEKAFKKVIDWKPDYSILAGDFNVVLEPKIDNKNYLHVNNPQAMQELKHQMQNLNLIDIWRELHPDERKYTWQKYNENKCSRLDFFLISSSLLFKVLKLFLAFVATILELFWRLILLSFTGGEDSGSSIPAC